MGLLLVNALGTSNHSIGLVLPAGFLVMLTTFEIVTVPILLTTKYQNFKYVIAIYTPVIIILSALGVYSTYKQGKKLEYMNSLRKIWPTSKETWIIWGLCLVVLAVILYFMETRVIFDGDDAFYVTQSRITQQNGTMYATVPYTGRAAAVDIRHAMAVFTMWIAYIGKLTGIHTTILCHTVLPLVIIPMSVMTFAQLGAYLLPEKKEMLPYFVLFSELLILFGRTSIYTSEAFLLARTWQGKSMAANWLIPMVFIALYILFNTENKARWILLLLVNTVAGIFSSLAVVLASILILVGGFVYACYKKSIRIFIMSGLCCVPGLIYMILYIYFTYWGWR